MSTHHKTFAGELLHGEFNAAWNDFKTFLGADQNVEQALEKGWTQLSPELQNALVHGATIVDEIAKDFDKVPADIIKEIQAKFPDIDLDKVKEALQQIEVQITNLKAVPADTLEDTIANLQAYFKSLGSSKIDLILSQFAQTVASVLSPTSLPGQIVSWIELAYRVFVKK